MLWQTYWKYKKQLGYFINNKSNENDKVYRRLINRLLENFRDYPEYGRFLVSNNYINEYVVTYINKYLELSEYDDPEDQIEETRRAIYRYLNSYKSIRGIIIGNCEYEKLVMLEE